MSDNKRIFKNTVLLAMRLPVVLVVGLFSSRVLLQQLGEVDFGVYQVVAGFILLIAFINSAMTTSIQRFMNVEMTLGAKADMQQVFSAAFRCIALVSLAFLVLAQTVGLWMMLHILNIPEQAQGAAMVVFQLAVLSMVIEFFRIPYFSMLVAHERMEFYAWHSILDVTFKLIAALLLFLPHSHRLEWYAVLLIGISVTLNAVLVVYFKWQYPRLHFSMRAPWWRVRQIGKFIGWTSLNSVSAISYQQGGNVILNVFYGVTLNATMGIVNQVKSGITSLSRNVLLASSPPMIKSFNEGNHAEFRQLLMSITRVVFLLIFTIAVPVILNADFILDVWLTQIPPSAATFMQWIAIFCIVDALTGPLETCMYACGRLGAYQITVAVMWLLYLPLLYAIYATGGADVWIVKLQVIINAAIICARFFFVHRYCDVAVRDYATNAILRILLVAIVGAAVPVVLACALPTGVVRLLLTTATAVICIPAAMLFVCTNNTERQSVLHTIKSKILKRNSPL